MLPLKRVCIFCASSPGIDTDYFEAAKIVAGKLLDHNVAVNYGGGHVGLMGAIADEYLKRNGKITGFIPVFMNEMKWSHPGVNNMVMVRDMHERKYRMRKGTDAIIALPGGVGTLEELLEVITLKQLGQYIQPIIILNINGFYDPLFDQLKKMIKLKFMRDIHGEIWTIISDPSEIINAIQEAPIWDANALKFAAVINKHDEDEL
mgnify:CR=1 FL=1